MWKKFKQRSYELEHLDTGNYTDEEYEGCIVELQRVNKWMGDARTLAGTLFKQIEHERIQRFSVLDVGAGSGELLRVTARWAQKTGRQFDGFGLELNERSTRAINEESRDFPTIVGLRGDAFRLPFLDSTFDYAICSLFTHHFVDQQVVTIFREMQRVARRRIFVIDLLRHPIAYLLYTTLGKLVLHTRLVREDGALSILRSFNKKEMQDLALQAALQDVSVERHFPFRLVLSAAGTLSKSPSMKFSKRLDASDRAA